MPPRQDVVVGARSGAPVELPGSGAASLDADLRQRLAEPLTPEAAVEIAWLQGPRARAALARLGLASADLFEASRPRNPSLSLGRLGSGATRESSIGLHLALTDLLTLPARRRIGEARWQAVVAESADALLAEASAVREAYFEHLAATQVAAMRAAVAESFALSAELARRLHRAGNISALQLAREEAAETQARGDAAQARAERLASRMRLAERLGLAGRTNAWRLPERLPLPAAGELAVDDLLARAQAQRADLVAARLRLAAGADQARLSRRTAWLGDLDLGLERENEAGERRRHGVELELSLPLFDQGQGRIARAEARRELALQQEALIGLRIEQEVRSGLARLQTQRDIIDTYREALLPQRQTIVAREQERYSFMLVGAFELIEARRQEFDTYQAYIEAVRDYWLAHAALERAIGGALPLPPPQDFSPPAAEIIEPSGGDAHAHHGQHGATKAPSAQGDEP